MFSTLLLVYVRALWSTPDTKQQCGAFLCLQVKGLLQLFGGPLCSIWSVFRGPCPRLSTSRTGLI